MTARIGAFRSVGSEISDFSPEPPPTVFERIAQAAVGKCRCADRRRSLLPAGREE
jgi:hypothetical protein